MAGWLVELFAPSSECSTVVDLEIGTSGGSALSSSMAATWLSRELQFALDFEIGTSGGSVTLSFSMATK